MAREAVEVTAVAGKRLTVTRDGERVVVAPGEALPEAAEFRNLRAYVGSGHVKLRDNSGRILRQEEALRHFHYLQAEGRAAGRAATRAQISASQAPRRRVRRSEGTDAKGGATSTGSPEPRSKPNAAAAAVKKKATADKRQAAAVKKKQAAAAREAKKKAAADKAAAKQKAKAEKLAAKQAAADRKAAAAAGA